MASVAPRLRARPHGDRPTFENTYSNPAGIRSGVYSKEFAVSYHSAFFDIRVDGDSERDPVVPERSGGLSSAPRFPSPSRVGVRTG